MHGNTVCKCIFFALCRFHAHDKTYSEDGSGKFHVRRVSAFGDFESNVHLRATSVKPWVIETFLTFGSMDRMV